MVNENRVSSKSISHDFSQERKEEYWLGWIWGILLILEGLLSFLLANTGTNEILWWTGWAVWGIGLILVLMPFIIFPRKGGVAAGKSFVHTSVLVSTGMYGIVRHPQYFGGALIMVSLILITPHWIVAACGIPGIILLYITTKKEDNYLIKKFGEEYRTYMKFVPRWNIALGIMRLIRRKIKT